MTINGTGRSSTMAAVTDSEFRQMKKFMSDSCFTCTDEWLHACMTWIKENNRSITIEVWKRELSEQWKDANLEEMESVCLPLNLSNQRLVKLPGKYGLQVNLMQDIGESSYSQWTKLKKLENENTSVAATDSTEYTSTWQPTPKRCLYLTMTDGSQKVFGLEMQPIPGLNLNMKPGLKIIIQGPVDCRRGVVHLRSNNVRVIGGEVDDLLEANRMEKILAETLKLTTSQLTQQSTRQNAQPDSTSTARRNRNPAASNRDEEISGDFPDSEDPFPDIGADDDIFMEIDEEALLRSASNSKTASVSMLSNAATRSMSQMTTQKISDSCSTRTTFTEEIEDFEDDDSSFSTTGQSSNSKSSKSVPSKVVSSVSATSSGNNAAVSIRKPKPLFVPPIAQPKPALNTGASSAGGSSAAKSSDNLQTKLVAPAAFKSAKSALNTNNGSKTNNKQQKILQYMKPMPVVIDPPTPERQAKRRRKSEEQDPLQSVSAAQPDVPAIPEERDYEMLADVEAETPPTDVNTDDDQDYMSNGSPPDESLLKIVDETLENKLLESDTTDPSSSSSGVCDSEKKSYPVVVSESPYVYLAQVQVQIDELIKKRKVVLVKACISTVVSNIQVDNGCWTLCVCINDGTGYLNCKINDNILNRIIGFTPAEMKKIKAAKTQEGKQKIAEGMNNLAQELVHLNAIFAIEIGEQPMITEIIDFKLHHSAGLKSRLFQLGL